MTIILGRFSKRRHDDRAQAEEDRQVSSAVKSCAAPRASMGSGRVRVRIDAYGQFVGLAIEIGWNDEPACSVRRLVSSRIEVMLDGCRSSPPDAPGSR